MLILNGPIRAKDETTLRAAVHVVAAPRKAKGANFKANFLFFTSLSTAEEHTFGAKFIELYGTVGFLRFGTFPF